MSFVARCFLAKISKTGRYMNVVCCKVKTPHSEQSPGPNAFPNSFRGERVLERGPTFFLSCFSFAPFVPCPLELRLGTCNPRFVACLVVESRNGSLGRRQKRETKTDLGLCTRRECENMGQREKVLDNNVYHSHTYTDILTSQSLLAIAA